jgi:hypothetical protein
MNQEKSEARNPKQIPMTKQRKNPKPEIRNSKPIQQHYFATNSFCQNSNQAFDSVWHIGIFGFDIVSDFEIRISDFPVRGISDF